MKYRVYTASGAVHEVDVTGLTYQRFRAGRPRAGMRLADLRRDGEQLRLLVAPDRPVVGFGWLLVLEPLDPAAEMTLRTTTPVTSFEMIGGEGCPT